MATTRKRKNYWIWIILAVLAIGIAAFFIKRNQKEEFTTVQLGVAEKRTIYAKIVESGTIEPTIEVVISPDVSGEIVELFVKEGQVVKRGDLLLTIRPDNYKSALEQSQASLNLAQSDYMQAQASVNQIKANLMQDSVNLDRTQKLNAEKIVSNVELENAKLKYKLTKAQLESNSYTIQAAFYRVESAKSSLKQSQQNLTRTNIYATMNGTITKLNVEKGQRVVGTVQMAGTELLKIADLSSMEVLVDINENDVVNLELLDSAKIEVDAFTDKAFYGKVTDIAYSANKSGLGTSDQVTNFQVKVRITPSSYGEIAEAGANKEIAITSRSPFRPGMSAQVEIYTDKVEDVIAVPIQSVTLHREKTVEKKEEKTMGGPPPPPDEKPQAEADKKPKTEVKKQEIVFVFENGAVREANVVTGIADDTHIQIKEGVAEGAKVVIGPYTTLTKLLEDGMKVQEEKEKETLEKK